MDFFIHTYQLEQEYFISNTWVHSLENMACYFCPCTRTQIIFYIIREASGTLGVINNIVRFSFKV